jgi:hypothetical protein
MDNLHGTKLFKNKFVCETIHQGKHNCMGQCSHLAAGSWWKANQNSWGKEKGEDGHKQKHNNVHFNIYKYFFLGLSMDSP